MRKGGRGWRGVWVAGCLVFSAGSGYAFVADMNLTGQVRRWALNPTDARVRPSSVNRATGAIVYHLDPAGWSATNAAAELDAIRVALDQWAAVPGGRVRFEEGALMSGLVDVNSTDHTNTLFWARNPNLRINGGQDDLSGVLALTYVASFSDGNVIFDADTVFNGVQFQWFTDFDDPTTSRQFIEGIALHEIGHALGLRHSPVGGATMLAIGAPGLNSQVGLSNDELTAVVALYGTSDAARAVGRVTGRVAAGGSPILGAAVLAENLWGNLVAGTVTRSNGVYDLPGLTPGGYIVRAAPLDPLGGNYLIRGVDIAPMYAAAETGFAPSADRAVSVVAGGAATADVDVFGGVPPRIVQLLRPARDLSQPGFTDKPVTMGQGQSAFLGVLTAATASVTMELNVTGDGVIVGPTVVSNAVPGLTMAAAWVTIADDATPGLRSFRLRRGTQIAWAHGFIEIPPPFPDVNFDGLDDRFQRQYWRRFTQAAAAPGADPDADGFTNAWEFETGSDPTNGLSAHFAIESVRVTAAGARVRSQTAAGKRFQLITRETIPGAEWMSVGAPKTATGPVTDFEDPGATQRVRFYRVQLLP